MKKKFTEEQIIKILNRNRNGEIAKGLKIDETVKKVDFLPNFMSLKKTSRRSFN